MKTILIFIIMVNGQPKLTTQEFADELACENASVIIMEETEKLTKTRVGEIFNVGCTTATTIREEYNVVL